MTLPASASGLRAVPGACHRLFLAGLAVIVLTTAARGQTSGGGPPAFQPVDRDPAPLNGRSESASSIADTVGFFFGKDTEGWSILNSSSQVRIHYPEPDADSCKNLTRWDLSETPFTLSWDAFEEPGALKYHAPFEGFQRGECDYEFWHNWIGMMDVTGWTGIGKLAARVYNASGNTIYAGLGCRSQDTLYHYYLDAGDWTSLSRNDWTVITLDEPSPGKFADVEKIVICFGSWGEGGDIYIDWVIGVDPFPPAPPVLIGPPDQSHIEANKPTFAWQGDADYFTLEYSTGESFANAVTVPDILDTVYIPAFALPNGVYYWRVKAFNFQGESSEHSPVFSFTIEGPYEVPSEFPNIQAAVSAFPLLSTGTVLVAPGIYKGLGNRDIDGFVGKTIEVVSAGGPGETVIDCQGSYGAFVLGPYVYSAVIDGFTIVNANAGADRGAIDCLGGSPTIRNCIVQNSVGRGIWLRAGDSPVIDNCAFENGTGYALYCEQSDPIVTNCDFNSMSGGGAVFLGAGCSASISQSTFVGNDAGIFVESASVGAATATISLSQCIIAFSTSGAAVQVDDVGGDVILVLSCCDLYGNKGGDWAGYIADQVDENGNIWLDPLFCDEPNGDYTLYDISPCAAENSDCGQVGRYGVACLSGPTLVVAPDTLDFEAVLTEATLTIINSGGGTLNWAVSDDREWISVAPPGGSTTSETDDVIVTVDRGDLEPGLYEGTVTVESDGGEETVHVVMAVGEPLLVVPPPFVSDVLIDSLAVIRFNKPVDTSTIGENVSVVSASGGVVNVRHYLDENASVLTIEPVGGFFPALDTLDVVIGAGLRDVQGISLAEPYVASFTTGVGVYPGDANDDGVVDERDVLPIGYYFGFTGPGRDSVSTWWGLTPVHVKVRSTVWDPYLAAYADADGSSRVDGEDVCAVAANWQRRVADKLERGGETGPRSGLASLDASVALQLYESIINCPEGEGKDALEQMLASLVDRPQANLPTTMELHQNYPNPFNPATSIEFYLPDDGQVTLTVYNTVGQRVAVLLDGHTAAGFTEVVWDGTDGSGHEVASGVYLYRLETRDKTETRRMLLLK
ncbi:MAG TPA: right-handed parallel beta-helix repeat-containing protein [Acidobacteriota bacterium]|nr:right-handed parallel beta-helix repeat-containing protein [Acidobacteriota bacterium]